MLFVSISGSRGNISKGNEVALVLFLFQLQGRRCNWNHFIGRTWKGQRKDANAFCTQIVFVQWRAELSRSESILTPPQIFQVTRASPSLSLSCSEKAAKFEVILGNKSSLQITYLRKCGAWGAGCEMEVVLFFLCSCLLRLLHFWKALHYLSVFLKHLEFWSGV